MNAVGLIVALDQERRSLTSQRAKSGEHIALDEDRWLMVSDAGPEAARHAAEFLAKSGARSLVSWGCAGGLSPELDSGDLVIPDRIVQTNGESISTDTAWAKRIIARISNSISVHQGTLLETPRIVATAAEKAHLFDHFGALALDMESAAIARIAYQYGLPFVAIRSVVDPATTTLPSSIESSFDAKGRLLLPKLLLKCVFQPQNIGHLFRLGRHFNRAMTTLSRVDQLLAHNLLATP